MIPLLQLYALSKCQNIIGQSTNINVLTCFSSFLRERERERDSKFGYKGEMSPKLLIFRRGSTGESFFFHGLIDFVLFFLHWLEEPGVPHVSEILLSSTQNTGYGSSARYEPCSKTAFLIIYFRWGEGVPANHSASLFLLPGQPIS